MEEPMKAVVFEQFKTFPVLKDVERPTPGPGEVLLKIAGAGACHSDVAMFDEFEADPNGGLMDPPFVLGHENSGWAEEVGEGVTGIEKGDAFLCYGPTGCGRCPACSRGQDTYCENPGRVGYLANGIGRDGGMAEYMVAPRGTWSRSARTWTRSRRHRSRTPASRRTTRSSARCRT